jgi:polysaccharide deacetylase family protein (PEP-CTERM system associated)
MLNALTIDVEDYYQVSAFESVVRYETWDYYESRVEQNTYHILDLLDEYRTKATFFVLGWIAERHTKLVRIIHERGHEVASHGYSHQRVYTQSAHQFCEETRRSKGILEDTIGQAVMGYRAASYSITKKSLWALDVLTEEGFRYDSSIFPIRHDLYGISDSRRFSHLIQGRGQDTILECPLSTVRIAGINIPVAGGGYLRMFPHRFTQWAIRHLNEEEKQPAIVYFHPWELDPDQPRIRTHWKSRFRHYTQLSQMEVKLRKLLSSFTFGPMVHTFRSMLVGHGI